VTLAQGRDEVSVSATALSRWRQHDRKSSAVSRVARLSLLGFAILLLVSSCIVADPPEYRDPLQTRPVLDVYQAIPTTSRILVVYTNDKVPISVPVRSEDAGEDLIAHFFIDYGTASPDIALNNQTIPASTYNDTGREVTFEWTVKVAPPGCHLLSLVVAHRSSFLQMDNDSLDPAKADLDAAIINWWLNVNPSDDMVTTLTDCPTSGLPSP
jgi:hypothetical protein